MYMYVCTYTCMYRCVYMCKSVQAQSLAYAFMLCSIRVDNIKTCAIGNSFTA